MNVQLATNATWLEVPETGIGMTEECLWCECACNDYCPKLECQVKI